MTGDHRFEEAIVKENNLRGGMNNMCEVLDRLIGEGRKEGMEKGMQQAMQLDNALFSYLIQHDLKEEALKAANSNAYKKQLLVKYNLVDSEVAAIL